MPVETTPRWVRRTLAWDSFSWATGKSRTEARQKEQAMAITSDRKTELIREFATHDGDTGSPEVQVALLTENIKNLTTHLQANKRDFTSRRGLLMMVGDRSRLLKYLRRKDEGRYQGLIQTLDLRR